MMGMLIYCDGDDCQNSDHSYNGIIYTLSNEVEKKFNINGFGNLCEICLPDYINEDEVEIEHDYITLREDND